MSSNFLQCGPEAWRMSSGDDFTTVLLNTTGCPNRSCNDSTIISTGLTDIYAYLELSATSHSHNTRRNHPSKRTRGIGPIPFTRVPSHSSAAKHGCSPEAHACPLHERDIKYERAVWARKKPERHVSGHINRSTRPDEPQDNLRPESQSESQCGAQQIQFRVPLR